MTKNRSMRIAVLVLALALITCCFVGTTFAKYTSSANGTGTLTVASWNVTGTGFDSDETFALVTTVVDDNDVKSSTADAAVDSTKIAPGTGGKFAVELAIEADVDANYSVLFTLTNDSDIPLQFTTNPDDAESWSDDIADCNVTGTYLWDGEAVDEEITVFWRWAYESGDDDFDTDLGINGATATVNVALNVTQNDTRPQS